MCYVQLTLHISMVKDAQNVLITQYGILLLRNALNAVEEESLVKPIVVNVLNLLFGIIKVALNALCQIISIFLTRNAYNVQKDKPTT